MAWMAWTWQTATFFMVIGGLLCAMALWERLRPGGAPRRGVFGLHTTRGDRLFISLLGAAYLHMLWLGFVPLPVGWALPLSLGWAVWVFRRV